jgi:hypothetical protein
VFNGFCPRWLVTLFVLKPIASNVHSQIQDHITTDYQLVSQSWYQVPSGAKDEIFVTIT